MNIQYGDVILVHGSDPLSKVIQNITRSYWSHTLLALEMGRFAQMGSLGFTAGVQSLNRPYAILRHKTLLNPYSLETRRILINMRSILQGLEAEPPTFDYIKLMTLGIKLLGQRALVSVADKKVEAFVCSGLVDYVYEQAGLDLRPGKDPRDTTPANLAELGSGDNPTFLVIFSNKEVK